MTDSNSNQNQNPQAKWFGMVNDTLIPMPQRRVRASVLRVQGAVPADHVLFRDHNSPKDTLIKESEEVDLAAGNVFYSRPGHCEQREDRCDAPPKLAWAVNDRAEITLLPQQSGRSVRELFGLAADIVLIRDFESPMDRAVTDADALEFTDGPVFITRKTQRFCVNIEDKFYPWDEPTISTAQIRALGHLPADQSVVVEDAQGNERTLREDEVIHLESCCRVGRAPKYKRG